MKLTEPQLRLLRKLFRGYGLARHGARRAAEARTLGRLIDKGLVESAGIEMWLPSATARRLLDEADARDRAEHRGPEVCSEHGWVGSAAYYRDGHDKHDRRDSSG